MLLSQLQDKIDPDWYLNSLEKPNIVFCIQIVIFLLQMLLILANFIILIKNINTTEREIYLKSARTVKYAMIPLYAISGFLAVFSGLISLIPLPIPIFLMIGIFGLAVILFLDIISLIMTLPFALAYIIKARKDNTHPKWLLIIAGIAQFIFTADIISVIILSLKERIQTKFINK